MQNSVPVIDKWQVYDEAGEHLIDLRTAAFVLAIRRVGEAARAGKYLKKEIQL
jgi:glutamate dehydrogenase/leucine dehydrogenase